MYADGLGVAQDDTQAVLWYGKVADQGYAEAQYRLGCMYAEGRGVARDIDKAVFWYQKAADQGHATAQYNLGVLYQTGEVVPQDDVEAHKWFTLAASRATGDDRKQYLERRDKFREIMTPWQIAEAQRRAREWQGAFGRP